MAETPRREGSPRCIRLRVPRDELSRIPEGADFVLRIDGTTFPVTKRGGKIVARESSTGTWGATPSRGVSGSPKRATLLARLHSVVSGLSDAEIERALGQRDAEALATLAVAEVLSRRSGNAIDQAHARGVDYQDKLLERAGGCSDVKDIAAILGIGEEAVRRRLRERKLIGFKSGRNYQIPNIQFRSGAPLPGLAQVLQAMTVESPWMRLHWLMTPEPRLGNRVPADVLRLGKDLGTVVAAAKQYAEQGAA